MSTTLKTGDKAPAFTSQDQNGNTIKLTAYKGKKVVLYFYPKDDTPGCTKEACNFRDNFNILNKKGIEVIGISTDSVKSHGKFADKYDLPFTLIADEEKTIVADYGVWGEKKFMGKTYMGTNRTTFIIDEKGIIQHIITKVDTTNSTEQVLELIEG
jgi:thioredoxin-dependent peroxiredoxin